MFVTSTDDAIYFDVDNTLVMWEGDFWQPAEGRVQIHQYHLIPHREHIEALKAHHRSGRSIVVWSQGGAFWARDVVKALKLENYVEACVSKPVVFYDYDVDANAFMLHRHYLERK